LDHARKENKGGEEMRGKRRGRIGPPMVGSHPTSKILKNTLIAKLI